MNDNKQQGNADDYLANERTLLAWIRTSIGIMVFGFVVVKFSLFIKQMSLLLGDKSLSQHKEYSGILGIALVALGAITTLLAYIRYRKTEKQLNEGNYKHSSSLIVIIIASIFLVSMLLIFYYNPQIQKYKKNIKKTTTISSR